MNTGKQGTKKRKSSSKESIVVLNNNNSDLKFNTPVSFNLGLAIEKSTKQNQRNVYVYR